MKPQYIFIFLIFKYRFIDTIFVQEDVNENVFKETPKIEKVEKKVNDYKGML